MDSAATAAQAASSPEERRTPGNLGFPPLPRKPLYIAAACVALAALSLLAPSAPTYDPWAWLIWGREVLHLDLVTTTGPSWKPLPVLFTTVFALAGDAAPSLWLVVARAGAIGAVALAYLVVCELGGGRLAAGAAAVTLGTAPWWTINSWLGNSEGLLVTGLLGAVLAHRRGHRHAAFAAALAAGLLRPEAWPFLGLYGLWLASSDRGSRGLVAGGFALLPLLWLVPEQLGSGDLLRAANRARADLPPDTAALAAEPVREILLRYWELLPLTAWVAVLAGLLLAVRDRHAKAPVLALAALTSAWIGIVTVMTSSGYSGNVRYLIAPAALALVLAGVGLGAVAELLPAVARPLAVAGALALLALPGLRDTIDRAAEARAQSELPGDLEGAVERAGGRDRLAACGPVVTEPLLTPQVAWRLRLHQEQVLPDIRRGDSLVVQGQVSPQLAPYPDLARYAGLPQRTLATAPRWRILVVGRCAA